MLSDKRRTEFSFNFSDMASVTEKSHLSRQVKRRFG